MVAALTVAAFAALLPSHNSVRSEVIDARNACAAYLIQLKRKATPSNIQDHMDYLEGRVAKYTLTHSIIKTAWKKALDEHDSDTTSDYAILALQCESTLNHLRVVQKYIADLIPAPVPAPVPADVPAPILTSVPTPAAPVPAFVPTPKAPTAPTLHSQLFNRPFPPNSLSIFQNRTKEFQRIKQGPDILNISPPNPSFRTPPFLDVSSHDISHSEQHPP